jgi:hypothetical protein
MIVCIDQQDHACVPCGHRYCNQCIAQVSLSTSVIKTVWLWDSKQKLLGLFLLSSKPYRKLSSTRST